MERLYHLSVAVLIVIFNHCLGEKTFKVDLVQMPALGNPLIDVTEEDKTVKRCEVLDANLKQHFMCSKAVLRQIKPFKDNRSDIRVRVNLTRDNGFEEGTIIIHAGSSQSAAGTAGAVSGIGTQSAGGYSLQLVDPMTIPEEMKPGTKVSPLFSVKGLKSTDKVKYRLEGEDSKYLKIDKDTGQMRSSDPVDRDGPKGRSYLNRLTLTVMINKDKLLSMPLNITVVDINDNSPTFVKHIWRVEVPENSTKYPIATLKCTDLDEGDNGKIVQSISSPPGITLFSMSGQSLLVEPLDYEAINNSNKSYVLTVIAVDQPKQGVAARTGTATVIVKVLPKNEFSPEWVTPFKGGNGATYSHTAYKNTKVGAAIFKLVASDKDDGPDGQITYGDIETLSGSGKPVKFIFHVDDASGIVHVISDLTEPSYILKVFASDIGSANRSINATITISVEDPPKEVLRWTHGQQKTDRNIVLDMPKDIQAGRPIASVAAKGVGNTPVTYEMGSVKMDSPDNKKLVKEYIFIVGPTDGKILALRTFKDYEKMGASSFIITVFAKSGQGSSQKEMINCTVTINLPKKKVNHAPIWKSPFVGGSGATGVVTVPENTPPGSTVATVEAVDNDEGLAGNLTYRIGSIATDDGMDASRQFSFDPNTGVLTILSDLDLENGVKSFTVMLTALDRGDPPMTIQGILTVQISDVNEYSPELDNPFMYRTTVKCDVQEGDDVLKIKMTDKDAASHFKLTPTGRTSDYVVLKMLGPDSAAVFLKDRPPPEKYEDGMFEEFLQFTLSDGGKPEKTTGGRMLIKYLECDLKVSTIAQKPTNAAAATKIFETPEPTKQPDITTTPKVDDGDARVTPEMTPEPEPESNTTEYLDVSDLTFTELDVTASSEQPPWVVPSSQSSGGTTYKPVQGSSPRVNTTKPHTGQSGSRDSDGETGNWVVRSLCIILFLGYVAMGGIYLAKKFSLLNFNCLRPKTAVHPRPEGENDNNDNIPGGSVVDYSERHADNMPDITAALAIASPNFMDSYPRELPQPPVSVAAAAAAAAAPSPAVPSVPLIAAVPSPAPLPPIPSILTEPPPAVPPLSTTTSQMPPKFLPPLPEGTRKLPDSCTVHNVPD